MKQLIIIFTTLLLVFPLMGAPKKCVKKCKKKCAKKYQPESWYLHIGLGSANITYDSNSVPAQNIDYYLSSRDSFYIDLGVYFPMNKQILLGGSISADIDHLELFDYENSYGEYVEWEEWSTILTSVSALYFFDRINRGLFVRGDLGVTHASYTNDLGDQLSTEEDQNGYGYRIGVGYALNLSPGWSMMATLSHSVKYIDDLPVKTNNLFFSIMF